VSYTSTHPATLDDEALLAQCDLSKNRSTGPGGQHRNKVESQIILLHRASGIEAQASERRSSQDNKIVALKRLRLLLAVAIRCPVPAGEIGTALWRSRLIAGPKPKAEELIPGVKLRPKPAPKRISVNPDHHDYPAILAEALDAVADADWDLKPAAIRLNVSPTQLMRLIKDHPPAFLKLNAERAKRGAHPLK